MLACSGAQGRFNQSHRPGHRVEEVLPDLAPHPDPRLEAASPLLMLFGGDVGKVRLPGVFGGWGDLSSSRRGQR